MNIPIRSVRSVYDVFERPQTPYVPLGPVIGRQPANVLSAGALQLPSGRDVSRELDLLFTRLAARAAERRSEVRLDRDASTPGLRSSLASSAQLNGAATSFGKVQLTFGSSTSVATLSGSYAASGGAAAATALRLDINQSTSLGSNPAALKFTVSDQSGAVLFSYDGVAKAGQAISLGADIGLQIAFSSGTLLADSNAQTSVSPLVATQVDPSAQFVDPDPNRRPRFEGGAQVVAGSFSVNGQRIEVRADDSISAVLQRISENVPDIEASFANDRVRLQSRVQSQQPIVVGDDTSGFLAATRLAGGLATTGSAPRGDERLSLTAQFAQVQAGGFKLGGRFVAVDPARDTLSSLMARMREAAPNVVAYVDRDQNVVLRAGGDDSVVLSDDSSGFLAAVGLQTGKPLPLRERFKLDEGTSQRLQQATSDTKSRLVRELLDYLQMPTVTATPPPEATSGEARPAASVGPTRSEQAAQAAQAAQKARTARLAYTRDGFDRPGGAANVQ